jgi:hypothetical protein
LWGGALQAAGGPSDPEAYGVQADAYDPKTWHDVAALTTLAARGLATNPAFKVENVSVLGSVELAGATALALPHLVDTTVIEYHTEAAEARGARLTVSRILPGMLGEYHLPNVSQAAFAELVAAAMATPESTEVLSKGVQAHQEVMTALARAGANPDQMLTRNVILQGMVDGAEHGGRAGVAERQDEQAQRAIDAVTSTVTAAATAPIPGIVGKYVDGAAKSVISGVAKSAVSYGIDRGAQWADDIHGWTAHLEAAQQKAGAETSDRREELGETIDAFGREFEIYPQVVTLWEERPPQEQEAGIAQYRYSLLNFYGMAYRNRYDDASTGSSDSEN